MPKTTDLIVFGVILIYILLTIFDKGDDKK